MRRIALIAALVVCGSVGAKETTKEDMSGKKEHQMANCPSAVAGAKTAVENEKEGVAVIVTSTDPKMRDEIRRRAHVQENVAMQSARGAIEHTGGGTGSGKFGFCPGLIQGTRVAVEDVPDGARMTVRAPSASEVQSLQQMTRARLRAMQAKR